MSERAKRPRNARIEALRVCAIACIAVFHTFQPWFEAATEGSWDAAPGLLAALGCVSLLGAFGNHVFFLISGFFLVPRAADASHEKGYWGSQLRVCARRAATILVSVALWAAVALAVNAWVMPVGRVSLTDLTWLVGGLQFIWVYLVVMLAVPLIGWVWARVRSPRATVIAIAVVVFAVNAYIAFVSPGADERGLLEWRKLMSAVSYVVAFLTGGALAGARLGWGRRALAASAAACVVAACAAGLAENLWLLKALSFKSTSLLSFALAVSLMACAAGTRPSERAEKGRLAALVRATTPSILGFYIAQSVFTSAWHPAANELLERALGAGDAAFLAVGVLASLVFLAVVLLVDRALRVSLLKLLHLA